MASLTHLPVEILLDILELVLLDGSMPKIGANAIWTKPNPPNVPGLPQRRVAFEEEGDSAEMASEGSNRFLLKSLRLTNKYLSRLCIPFLYREFNRLSSWPLSWSGNLQKYVIEPYWEHITVLRLCVDHSAMTVPDRRISVAYRMKQKYDVTSVTVLSACKNVRSLGLYYARPDADFSQFTKLVTDMLKERNLKALGVYYKQIIGLAGRRIYKQGKGAAHLLESIALSQRASMALEVLDIAAEDYTWDLYSRIRDGFPNLRSLSLRQVSLTNEHAPKLFQYAQVIKSLKPSLTKIQLVECYNLDISILCHFLRHVESIQDLTIIKCNTVSEIISRSHEYPRPSKALCDARKPLRSLHIEGMQETELKSLGVIPALKLTLASDNDLDILFQNPELFPGLKALHIALEDFYPEEMPPTPPSSEEHGSDGNTGGITLEGYCRNRGIKLRRDAERVLTY